jgi:transitional endoplasmic reticulum ATPase
MAVVVIAATNRPDMLDDALLRPGRFDKLLYVPPPDAAARLDILHIVTAHTPLGDCVDLQFLALATEFFSGADLGSLCREVSSVPSEVVSKTQKGRETLHGVLVILTISGCSTARS